MSGIARYHKVLSDIARNECPSCSQKETLFNFLSNLFGITSYCQVDAKYLLTLSRYGQVLILFNIFVGCCKFFPNIVSIVRYHQVS
jgi:hypothetical protein